MDFGSPVYRSVSMVDNNNSMKVRSREQRYNNDVAQKSGWFLSTSSSSSSTNPKEQTMPPCPPPPRPFRQSNNNNSTALHSTCAISECDNRKPSWFWKIGTVSPVPMFYPIQKWNTLTVDHLPLGTITSRISEFLRLGSIAAQYNNDEGSVRCQTQHSVEFVINVWKHSNTEGAFFVHTQHICGPSMEMSRIQSDLWNSILNVNNNTTRIAVESCNAATDRPRSMWRTMPVPEPEQTNNNNKIEQQESSPLDICRTLLESQRWSERQLGMESLVVLTDRTKTTPSAAEQAVSAVLLDASFQNLLSEHLSFATTSTTEKENLGRYENEMHLLALQALHLSLQSYSRYGMQQTLEVSANQSFWGTVLNALLSNIQNASSRPLEANLSVQCLACLNDISQIITKSLDASAFSTLDISLQNAYNFGSRHNLSLQHETEQLLCRMSAVAR